MGTRSRVGVMHGSVCKSVYCHFDGYLDYTGKLLQQNYSSVEANALVARGDNSGVQESVEVMDFYSDRGEYSVAHTFEEFLDQVKGCGCEYYYVMQEGVWYVGAVYHVPGLIKDGLVPLVDALATHTIDRLVAEDE